MVGVDGNPETLDAIRNGDVAACSSGLPTCAESWTGIMADKWINGRSDLIPAALYFGGDVVTYRNIGDFKHLSGN